MNANNASGGPRGKAGRGARGGRRFGGGKRKRAMPVQPTAARAGSREVHASRTASRGAGATLDGILQNCRYKG
jgi:hypothetical protein